MDSRIDGWGYFKTIMRILLYGYNFRDDNSATITISKLLMNSGIKLYLLSENALSSNIDIFEDKYSLGDNHLIITLKETRKKKRFDLLSKIIGSKGNYREITEKIHISNDLDKWIHDINPNYIYFTPSTLYRIKFVKEVLKKRKSKIIIHVLDDKVNSYFKGIIGLIYKKKFKTEFNKIILNSDLRLSISNEMARVYKFRYGRDFYTFHNCIDIPKLNNKSLVNKCKYSIVYMGVVENNYDAIFAFSKAVEKIKNIYIELVLYTKQNINTEKLRNNKNVTLKNYVSQDDIIRVLYSYDFILLPLSFKRKSRFIKLSMPTKTAECMASRTPTIILAPKYTALYAYAERGKWGFCINTVNVSKMIPRLLEYLQDTDLQKKHVEKSIYLAKINHDLKTNQTKFLELLK